MGSENTSRPGPGFVLLLGFVILLTLLLSWTFDTSRIEETILLEDRGMKQLYRNRPDEALEYFRRSAAVDTDKSYHILRYRDSLLLALQTGNAAQAEFFANELLAESPQLLDAETITGLLGLQAAPAAAVDLAVRLWRNPAIDLDLVRKSVTAHAASLDAQARAAFITALNQALPQLRVSAQ